jgi:hypothetical protein
MTADGAERGGWKALVEPEMIVALSAVLIGVCALVVSVVQVRIMRQEQHATVWPQLFVSTNYSQAASIGILIANAGIGPAMVRSFTAEVDGEEQSSWPGVLNAITGEDRGWNLAMSFVNGRTIPAGEAITTVFAADAALADRIAQAVSDGRLDLSVCYCSVYERCWMTRLQGDVRDPEPVRACPRPERARRFRG